MNAQNKGIWLVDPSNIVAKKPFRKLDYYKMKLTMTCTIIGFHLASLSISAGIDLKYSKF
jgi:hypothetical protein